MLQSWQEFAKWLSDTPFSLAIQTRSWAIPSIQVVHILAIAVVLSSAIMFNMRVLGFAWRGETLAAVTRRFLKPTWIALVVLLASGTLLVIAEPGRSITNPAFLLKMGSVILVVLLNLYMQSAVRREPQRWDHATAARVIAVCSLVLWSLISVCGRLIAYVESLA